MFFSCLSWQPPSCVRGRPRVCPQAHYALPPARSLFSAKFVMTLGVTPSGLSPPEQNKKPEPTICVLSFAQIMGSGFWSTGLCQYPAGSRSCISCRTRGCSCHLWSPGSSGSFFPYKPGKQGNCLLLRSFYHCRGDCSILFAFFLKDCSIIMTGFKLKNIRPFSIFALQRSSAAAVLPAGRAGIWRRCSRSSRRDSFHGIARNRWRPPVQ